MREREDNEMIISLDSHSYQLYISSQTLRGEEGLLRSSFLVTLKSKAKLFLNIERKSHKTMLCNSELSSYVQLRS